MAAPIPRAAEQWDTLVERLTDNGSLVEKGLDWLTYRGRESGRLYKFTFEDYLSGSQAQLVEEE